MTKKDIAYKIWEAYFGSKKEVEDAFNFKIKKTLYGKNSLNGWTIDHIWPLKPESLNDKKGANVLENLQPLSLKANKEKANTLQGSINRITFAISKNFLVQNNQVVGRMSIKNNEEWFWAYDEPKY